jgi:(2R)-sulfolactate sulfo-lyase subunit alpha
LLLLAACVLSRRAVLDLQSNLQSNRCPPVSKNPHFLIHDHKDNVGVVVIEDLAAGTNMLGVITEDDSTTKCKAKDSIPIGHKVALTNLKKGDTVIKYGVDIGIMTADAKKGEHVHVHNLKTKKW